MAKVITYECKECGCEIIVSGSQVGHLRPIYCCGVEVEKISPASKGSAAKKAKGKKVSKAVTKATKKAVVKKPVKEKARELDGRDLVPAQQHAQFGNGGEKDVRHTVL